ncbi:MAG TPA: hypothetical protein PK992_13245, partial [Planctomycetaceae bacterium]|nr:hypothetical protein [Planctomycetaceae bacterium]
MIEEIIYTSAPKGLKAGSRGFCTVVSTAGMAVNTAERLESMSGYRHAFPMQDPKAPLNPVNYSHVTLRIGGRNVHVISRVADAGQDYSGRTNKLAHHLVIDDVSQFTAGPARLMTQSGVLVSQWDGNTRNIPPRNLPIPLIPPSIELKAWKAVTGDSGWAGWVAEQLTKDKAPVSVIFAAGTDTLALVQEVLDVLPPSQRWPVTFSTYFTKMLAGTECQLRFVLDDTPEATAIRNDARAKVVDLTKTLAPATGGAIVAQARSGRIMMTESPPPVQRQPAPGRPAASSRVGQAPVEKDTGIDIPALRSPLPDMPEFQSPALPPVIANPFDSRTLTKKRSSGWWKYVVGAVLLVASSSLITFFVMKQMYHGAETLSAEGRRHAAGTDKGTETSAAVPGEPIVASAGETEVESKPDEAPPVKTDVAVSETPTRAGEGEAPSNSPPPDTPKPPQDEKFDPFRLVLKDPQFKYPNHEDLLLFELPAPTPGTKSKLPSMPLVCREEDTVQLSLHETFKHLINFRSDDGTNGPDIRLSDSKPKASERVWKAELFRDGKSELEFGTYSLEPGAKSNSL